MKTITVKITKEVEPCKRCDGYIEGDMHFVELTSRLDDDDTVDLFSGVMCGTCRDIIINSLTKRTRTTKTPVADKAPTTAKGTTTTKGGA